MDPRLAQLLQKTSLYGTLAMYYEHIDPEKHIYFYKKHLKYETQLVQLYWTLHGTMENSPWRENYPL
ncbi:hypothetical protein [Terrilactibacillus laevilacticus]|uniref:Uncharacterized protein n=1 Tax=Terrilactibacillus laevilacticus TaxID=1380157 RepID=A0ABW5PRR8_9BACI|nr:hypothetical protein [Terrilactibacillus laevilacticus]